MLYEGDWSNNKICGKGIVIYAFGGILVSNFFNNKANGSGYLICPNGDIYIAEWKNGIPS